MSILALLYFEVVDCLLPEQSCSTYSPTSFCHLFRSSTLDTIAIQSLASRPTILKSRNALMEFEATLLISSFFFSLSVLP